MDKDLFEKLLFSIRMLHFHHYITDKEFLKMAKKLKKELNNGNKTSSL